MLALSKLAAVEDMSCRETDYPGLTNVSELSVSVTPRWNIALRQHPVAKSRDSPASGSQQRWVEIESEDSFCRTGIGEHFSPWTDYRAVTVARYSDAPIYSTLVGRDNETLVLYGPGANENLPVILACPLGEVGRCQDQMGALRSIMPDQFRESEVVAN